MDRIQQTVNRRCEIVLGKHDTPENASKELISRRKVLHQRQKDPFCNLNKDEIRSISLEIDAINSALNTIITNNQCNTN